ncbi:MAG: hypothetical protein ACRDQZ_20610 [Mycobacteriales bacterium]
MTCIVGIRSETGVMPGGDSVGVGGNSAVMRSDPKVFSLSKFVETVA